MIKEVLVILQKSNRFHEQIVLCNKRVKTAESLRHSRYIELKDSQGNRIEDISEALKDKILNLIIEYSTIQIDETIEEAAIMLKTRKE